MSSVMEIKLKKTRKTFSSIKWCAKKWRRIDTRRQHNERNFQIVVSAIAARRGTSLYRCLPFYSAGVCDGVNFVIIKSIYVNDKWKRLWILENNNSAARTRSRQLITANFVCSLGRSSTALACMSNEIFPVLWTVRLRSVYNTEINKIGMAIARK